MPRKKPTAPGFGIDFGTTNCSIALARQGAVTLARFTGQVESSRSILYAESQSAQRSRWFSGPEAITRYLDADAKGRAAAGSEADPLYDEAVAIVLKTRKASISSVQRQLRGGDAACFLSGGTDSSTVAGMLSRVAGRPADTYSIGFEAEGYDEMAFARIAAKHFGCRHHEYYVTPADLVRAIPDVAAHYDQPFGNSSALPAYYCAVMAREQGVTRLDILNFISHGITKAPAAEERLMSGSL